MVGYVVGDRTQRGIELETVPEGADGGGQLLRVECGVDLTVVLGKGEALGDASFHSAILEELVGGVPRIGSLRRDHREQLDESGRLGIAAGEIDHPAEQVVDPLVPREASAPFDIPLLEDGDQQRGLVREVMLQGGVGDAAPSGDLAQ